MTQILSVSCKWISLAVLPLALLFSRPARAGGAALAESLFRQGRALMDQEDYPAACPKLAESFVQDPATGTLLALALCQERLGLTASAWSNFAEVVARSKAEGREDRADAAKERLDAIEPRLLRVTIQVAPAVASLPELVVKRDGLILGPGAWDAPSPVDPGDHLIEVTASGMRPWARTVTILLASDAVQSVEPVLVFVDALEPEPPPPPPSIPHAARKPVEPEPSSPTNFLNETPWRTVSVITGGVGLLTLATSAVLVFVASDLNEQSKLNGCPAGTSGTRDVCADPGFGQRKEAIGVATAGTVTAIVGGVLAATCATLFVVDTVGTGAKAAPVVGPDHAGLMLAGWF